MPADEAVKVRITWLSYWLEREVPTQPSLPKQVLRLPVRMGNRQHWGQAATCHHTARRRPMADPQADTHREPLRTELHPGLAAMARLRRSSSLRPAQVRLSRVKPQR